MPSIVMWVFIAIGLITCLLLSLFIRNNWLILEGRKEKDAEDVIRRKKMTESAVESIKVLARSMVQNQIELSEGCIRIKVLLDNINPKLHDDARFDIFNKIFGKLEHMPTHEARQEVNKQFLFKLDNQRWELEDRYRNEILHSARLLQDYKF